MTVDKVLEEALHMEAAKKVEKSKQVPRIAAIRHVVPIESKVDAINALVQELSRTSYSSSSENESIRQPWVNTRRGYCTKKIQTKPRQTQFVETEENGFNSNDKNLLKTLAIHVVVVHKNVIKLDIVVTVLSAEIHNTKNVTTQTKSSNKPHKQ